jgi:hypothetical protein
LEEVNMKKTGIGLLLLMCAVLVYAQTQSAAIVREASGMVEVKEAGSSEWKAVVPGQTLDTASLVSTGFKSTALIAIGNSLVTVRPLTRLSLEEIAANQAGEKVVLNLRAGRVRADVKPPLGKKTDFSVRSPIATASVRGTIFEFDGTEVKVDEGRVHLGGETVTGAYIGAGRSTAVNTETGSTVTVLENVKEELSPALPVGVDTASAETPAAVPANSGLDIGFDW